MKSNCGRGCEEQTKKAPKRKANWRISLYGDDLRIYEYYAATEFATSSQSARRSQTESWRASFFGCGTELLKGGIIKKFESEAPNRQGTNIVLCACRVVMPYPY